MTSISGFVNINKPTGMTSSDVVFKVKKILNIKKVGHLGTLDPAATGVLPIAVGKATKFFDYFLKKDKEYIAIAEFGIQTDSLDSFGKVVKTDDVEVNLEMLKSVLPKFIGKQKQVPPKYSAIKINGQRAYDLARTGENFELEARDIEVYDISVLNELAKNRFLLKMHTSAGTYIRTLVNDIAESLGTIATTTLINRTKSGMFDLESSITLDELEKNKQILSVEEVFKNFKTIEIKDEIIAKKIINGVKLDLDELYGLIDEDIFFIKINGDLIGFYNIENNKLNCIVFLA